jgi:3'-5' exoribonuclease
MIDLLDSRMMVLDKAYDGVLPGNFTEKIWSMDNVSFYKPKER